MIAAQDETYRDAKSIHSKWMRHQAFESEIKANKDRLEKLIKEASDLIEQKPELASVSSQFWDMIDYVFGNFLNIQVYTKIISHKWVQQLYKNKQT